MKENAYHSVQPFQLSGRKEWVRKAKNDFGRITAVASTVANIGQVIILLGIALSSLYALFNSFNSPMRYYYQLLRLSYS